MRNLRMVTPGVALALIAGCAGFSTSPATGAGATPTPVSNSPAPRRVVVGVDRTGSYTIQQAGVEQVARLLERAACPGDEWFLRRIEADSYAVAAAIRTVRFMNAGSPPERPANPLDRRSYLLGLQQFQARQRAFQQQRRQAAESLREVATSEAQATDVVGLFLKAEELLENTPEGYERVILVATDLEDNVGRGPEFSLPDTAVVILALEGDDPPGARELRALWSERLATAGAGPLVIRDGTEPADDVFAALARQRAASGAER